MHEGHKGLLALPVERPAGVTAAAGLFAVAALMAFLTAVMTAVGQWPLARGAFLLGAGLETAGPVAFVLFGALCLVAACGLLRRNQWARRLAILIALFGAVQAIPTVSAAFAYEQWLNLVREAVLLHVRVILVWYLWRADVRAAFD